MSMSSGPPPYIGSPTENLTLSDPRCNSDSCRAFYDAHQLSQKLTSYAHQFDYGHYVTWYYLAWIGVFAIAFAWRKWTEQRYRRNLSQIRVLPTVKDRAIGVWRSVAYRRWHGRAGARFGLPSLGLLAFMLLAILFCTLLTFWARPYYRNHRGYGSPPLAVRTGLMATALTPLILALSGKANIITLLTGIGHEKLNVYHRWASWICFALSVAHTVPFIVAPLRDGGYAALHKQFYKPGGYEYTGTPPLAILFGIVVLSVPWIRHRVYETFYHVHFWLAVTYVGLMFWHCNNQRDSWDYMWATLAIWLATLLARVFHYNRSTSILAPRWFVGAPVTCTTFPDNMTRIEVVAPRDFHWKPGQHIYLRIPTVGVFDNHPFTIAAADQVVSPNSATPDYPDRVLDDYYHKPRILPLYIRSHAGFTRRLRKHLDSTPDNQLDAWIEGPYGGHHHDLTVGFDHIILVAGGGGISAVLPWLEHYVLKLRAGERVSPSSIRLVWSVRHWSAVAWIEQALHQLKLDAIMPDRVQIVVHVTKEQLDEEKKSPSNRMAATSKTPQQPSSGPDGRSTFVDVSSSKAEKPYHPPPPPQGVAAAGPLMAVNRGRIDLDSLFQDAPARHKSRTVVVGCGPESLKIDLSNAVARSQSKVIGGQSAEICLWTETFGW